jgi:hypothetical protein
LTKFHQHKSEEDSLLTTSTRTIDAN